MASLPRVRQNETMCMEVCFCASLHSSVNGAICRYAIASNKCDCANRSSGMNGGFAYDLLGERDTRRRVLNATRNLALSVNYMASGTARAFARRLVHR